MTIAANIQQVKQTIMSACADAGRQDKVTLVAVTKYHTVAEAQAVFAAGVTQLAENRMPGLLEKQTALPDPKIDWHFIGHLQRRKVKKVINNIAYLHSLDRLDLAKEIEKRAVQPVKCFVEVNVSGEASKDGLALADVAPFIEKLATFSKIKVVGLMTMAPIDADDPTLHQLFKQLRQKRDQIAALHLPYAPCHELSMGMSRDYRIAVLEGATFVRIGTALFR